MESLDLGNLQNVYGNQGGMLILRSCVENTDYDSTDPRSSQIFIGPNPDDDDRYKFFMVCAENKINALIERVREFNDFGRSDEFEDEAVAMAIRQHGLRKNESPYDSPTPSTSTQHDDIGRKRKRCEPDYVKEGCDVDDLYFLNEAVAAAIEQKGLCSSSLGALN